MTYRLTAAAVLALVAPPALAQVPTQSASYSGVMEYRGEGRVQTANVYGAPMKSRMDMRMDGVSSTFIIDMSTNTALSYARGASAEEAFAIRMDMQGLEDRLGPTYDQSRPATRVGSDTIAGERCDLYRQDDATVCMTSDGILLRAMSDAGEGMEMRSLTRGPQPPHYFQLPAGYTVMDMRGGGFGAMGGYGQATMYEGSPGYGGRTDGYSTRDRIADRMERETRRKVDREVRDAAGRSTAGRVGGGIAGDVLGDEAGKIVGGIFGKKRKRKKKEED